MIEKIIKITGTGIPLTGNDIDTDRIIPARFLKSVVFDGLGASVFADDRKQIADQGGKHPFDDETYSKGTILCVNKNFGCGSSREHAPQALYRWGVSAIIGVSFAEIFRSNSQTIGMPLCVVTEEESIELQLFVEKDPTANIIIDLATKQITYGGKTINFAMTDGVQKAFVSGTWDPTAELIMAKDKIDEVAASLPYFRHWE